MKHTVKATVTFEIEVPAIDEIKEDDIPQHYSREEWHKELFDHAIMNHLDPHEHEMAEISDYPYCMFTGTY